MDAERFVVDLVVKKCSGITHVDIDGGSLLSSLPLGSLKVLEIVHEIEERFDTDIDERKLLEIETLSDIVNLVPIVESENG